MNTGDSMLCSNDMRLWGLVQHVIVTWSTLVIFKNRSFDVRDGSRGLVVFFVPVGTFRDEITAFLETELDHFKSDGFPARDGHPAIPGTDVEVVAFFGVMARSKSEVMVREMYTQFMQRVKDTDKDRPCSGS